VPGRQKLDKAAREQPTHLSAIEARELLVGAGIPVADTRLARTQKEAVALSREIGFPVVLKVDSPDIIHKSDAGGVKLGLNNAAQVGNAYRQITAAVRQQIPRPRIRGVTVHQMAPPGIEVIIGMSQDAQFGPVLMFGLGGVLVEVLRDVAFRIVPVTENDARAMIREIRGYQLLQGYRGQPAVDIPSLEQLLVKVSRFIAANPRVKELDLNPVIAYPDGAVAVDVRIILEALAES